MIEIQELQQKLSRVTDKSLNAEVEKLSLMKKSIELLDPQTILNRGYSLTVSNGKRVSKGNIKKGDVIQTLTKDMRISSKIEEIKQK
ncbi:MAG: exodeoxyribonuclease VII large subunit [Bacteroidota bacterium]